MSKHAFLSLSTTNDYFLITHCSDKLLVISNFLDFLPLFLICRQTERRIGCKLICSRFHDKQFYKVEVITIESKAFKQLMEKLDALSDYVSSLKPPAENEGESWVDSHEICEFLKVSERTLQRLRTNGKISYTNLGGKYYYQISQVKKLLKDNLIKSTEECFQELVEHHKHGRFNRNPG